MDRLLVATLNILNLADRWEERLPLLLADMAALQPDLIGLNEVVYPMQQDRLLGAAGEGRYEAVRGWAGRPEYGNSLLVKAPLAADEADRLDLGASRSAHRVLVALPGGPASCSRSRTSTTSRPTTPIRAAQADALLAWLDGGTRPRRAGLVGDFNAEPRRARLRAACATPASRPPTPRPTARSRPVTWPSGLHGPGDGHRRRPGLPRLHLAARRGRRRGRPARASTGRPSATRRSTRRTTSASPRTSVGDRRMTGDGPTDAPPRAPRRLARGAREHARRPSRPRCAIPGCDGVEFDVRLSGDGVPVVIHDETLCAGPAPPGARRRADRGGAGRARASRRWRTSSGALPGGAWLDVELKGGDHGRATADVLRAARGEAPGGRRRVLVRATDALVAMGDHLPGWAPLAERGRSVARNDRRWRSRLGCGGISAEWRAITPPQCGRAPRRVSTSRRGRSAGARRSTGWPGWASSPAAWRRRRSTAERAAPGTRWSGRAGDAGIAASRRRSDESRRPIQGRPAAAGDVGQGSASRPG